MTGIFVPEMRLNRGSIARLASLAACLSLAGCERPTEAASASEPVPRVVRSTEAATRWPDFYPAVMDQDEACDREFSKLRVAGLKSAWSLSGVARDAQAICRFAHLRTEDMTEPAGQSEPVSEALHMWLVTMRGSIERRARIAGVADRWATSPLSDDGDTYAAMLAEDDRQRRAAGELLEHAIAGTRFLND